MIDLPPGISRKHMAGPQAHAIRRSFREEHGLEDADLLVLQAGSGFITKGLERSLKALAALPAVMKSKVHFFVVGRDDLQPWRKRVKGMGLERVRFFSTRNDLERFMLGADLLLHPSVHESAGMVILEAIVAGLPVLCTENCGYAFHVSKADAGMICSSPFIQSGLDSKLLQMLQQDRTLWHNNGIAYGQQEALYDMPDAVADILLHKADK